MRPSSPGGAIVPAQPTKQDAEGEAHEHRDQLARMRERAREDRRSLVRDRRQPRERTPHLPPRSHVHEPQRHHPRGRVDEHAPEHGNHAPAAVQRRRRRRRAPERGCLGGSVHETTRTRVASENNGARVRRPRKILRGVPRRVWSPAPSARRVCCSMSTKTVAPTAYAARDFTSTAPTPPTPAPALTTTPSDSSAIPAIRTRTCAKAISCAHHLQCGKRPTFPRRLP